MVEPLEPRLLLSAGDLDPTFGQQGITAQPPQSLRSFGDILPLSNGKMLVVGNTFESLLAANEQYLLYRFNADGSLDATFGSGGTVAGSYTNNNGDSELGKAAIAPDGKIVAVGETDFASKYIVRFNADGSLDTTFGTGGKASNPDLADAAIAVASDGKIFVADTTGRVTRFLADGTLDASFGNGGNDQLNGEGGLDRLYSDYDSGNSTLHGGAGNDILITKNNLTDQLFGDGGHDSAVADSFDALTSIESLA